MNDPFWLPVGLIIVIGTIGSVLYEYGTDQIQGVTLERLSQIETSSSAIPYLVLLVGSAVMFFFAGYSLRDKFAASYLFYPFIFLALIMFLLRRFLPGIPPSQRGLGQVTALLTVLGVASTAFAGGRFSRRTSPIELSEVSC